MNKKLLVLFAVVYLGGCVIYLGDDDNGDDRELQYELRTQTLAGTDLSRLIATTGAGNLEIIGEEGRDSIEFSADIYAANPATVELSLRASGDTARLIAEVRNESRQGNRARIDLIVRMPARLALDLEDGSGNISIQGLQGGIAVDDGSGNLLLSGGASASIKDGSGHIVVERIAGDLFIEDGSGHLEVRDVGGEVTVRDGSGDISITSTGGLNILSSGSGGLSLRDIKGAVTL